MSVFVVVSLALAVVAVGMVVVSVVQVKAAVGELLGTLRPHNVRLRSLTDELQSELAVASTELAAIQARRHAREKFSATR